MDNTERKAQCCWVVRTKFYAGIFLSQAAVKKKGHAQAGNVIPFQTYEGALAYFKELVKTNNFDFDFTKFRVNRLLKVRNDRIYIVVYNRWKIGFTEGEEFGQFISKAGLAPGMYKAKGSLTYLDAVRMVWSLGAQTPKLDVGGWKNPSCGVWYRRCNG